MKLYLLAGAGLAALALITFSHVKAYQAGRTTEQAAIVAKLNQENDNAGNSAEKWRAALRACDAAGRLFDYEAGTCEQ
ncbi:MAG: hypothetical protein E5W72_17980 [Mesorhizobium sp.]|nr:MAG: hypothetical protein E5W72_17980 [Mesorhizobium sp.]